MDVAEEIELLLRARCTLISLVTLEEPRALKIIKRVCERREAPGYVWDIADGFTSLTERNTPIQTGIEPHEALAQIESGPEKAVYVLPDFHLCWKKPQVLRKLRTTAQKLVYTRKTIIIISSERALPVELKDRAIMLELPLPGEEELGGALEELLQNPELGVEVSDEVREQLVQAARGLTFSQAQRVFAKGIVSSASLSSDDVELVTNEKKDLIRESQALEFYPIHETPGNVGGLRALKQWLSIRKQAFSHKAREYGLPAPKGIALIGIPGTGKSLSAKMIGNLWGMPLIRLDVGALFGSFVGESEAHARKALQLAEAASPCVLWIDEMEKALSQGSQDGGTSLRVFGTILTWMFGETSPLLCRCNGKRYLETATGAAQERTLRRDIFSRLAKRRGASRDSIGSPPQARA